MFSVPQHTSQWSAVTAQVAVAPFDAARSSVTFAKLGTARGLGPHTE